MRLPRSHHQCAIVGRVRVVALPARRRHPANIERWPDSSASLSRSDFATVALLAANGRREELILSISRPSANAQAGGTSLLAGIVRRDDRILFVKLGDSGC